MKILADAHIPFIAEYFGSCGELILQPGRSIQAKDVKEIDALIVRSITRVDEELLVGSKVKFVGSVTAGADHLDTKYLDAAGIAWNIAAGFNAPPVADYVVSVVAALKRQKILSKTRSKAAIIGVGNVGKRVKERLSLLNFDVTLCDPLRAEKEADFNAVPLEELANLDIIFLHVPLSRNGNYPTYHFIDQTFLKKQQPGCVLLNASRGAVIDSNVLLESGGHLYWCLDVWEHEPCINKRILERALIATPHIAGYSVQSKIRGIDMIYRKACEQRIITPLQFAPLTMPEQELTFAGNAHHWEDIVLGVFNPLVITSMMRTIVLLAQDLGNSFDEMRNQFNYRHELAFTTLQNIAMANQEETALLHDLGLKMRCSSV